MGVSTTGSRSLLDQNGVCATMPQVDTRGVEQWLPTPREKELLRRTWSDEFKFLYELGSSIYVYIFEHNPHCKQLFPSIASYGDDYKDSREFRIQALRFVQVFLYSFLLTFILHIGGDRSFTRLTKLVTPPESGNSHWIQVTPAFNAIYDEDRSSQDRLSLNLGIGI
ncbi:unnamed protein product [Angiostrongylus costaricensis]|uniref:GLOBIN domain-containing protein n=1 Tax=Angiostrongylus costaricensis TaxID=334426 RepID=A0A0R3Q033_ANGCS|nr:unnamed protein product [Angiostrongylus costaricensis]